MRSRTTTFLLGVLVAACGGGADSSDDTEGMARENDDSMASAGDPDPSEGEAGGDESDPAEMAEGDAPMDGETVGNDTGTDEEVTSGSGSASLGAPAPCESNDDCPEGIDCKKFDQADALGFCNVDETVVSPDEPAANDGEVNSGGGVSLAAPAICASDDECPEGIECVKLDGSDEFGYCNVEEVAVE